MSQAVTIVIREDPLRSHRAVEALRIALGLGSGEQRVSVFLMDNAPRLLTEDRDEIIDVDILEKYLPSFQHLGIEFLVPPGTRDRFRFEDGFAVSEQPLPELQRRLAASDRVLVF